MHRRVLEARSQRRPLAAAHLEAAVERRALDEQPGRLDGERLQEEDARAAPRAQRRRAAARARDLEVARAREDDAALHDVVGDERVQRARGGRAEDDAAPPTSGTRRCTKGCGGSRHGKARRRRYTSGAQRERVCQVAPARARAAPRARSCRCTQTSSRRPHRRPSAASRQLHRQRARHAAQRRAHVRVERAQLRIRRRLARARSPSASLSSPVIPAAGSACPMFALTPPTASAAFSRCARQHRRRERARLDRVAERRARAVRLVERQRVDSRARVARSAATSSPCCAWPLGAVRLADRPSCRTALPSKRRAARPPPCRRAARSATPPHASPRAYPSARASNVCERPRADVMPATAKLVPTPGASISVTPTTSPTAHSASCSARSPAWPAASAAEHAVSYETHGPCSPSVYESRPAAIDTDAPVAAYTLPPAGDAASTCANSLEPAKPRKTPVRLPPSAARAQRASCSAA